MLRIRVVYPGSDFFPSRIPDRGSKNLSIFSTKKKFLSSRKYDPGCSSRIRILIFFLSRIRIQNTGLGSRIQDPGKTYSGSGGGGGGAIRHWVPSPSQWLKDHFRLKLDENVLFCQHPRGKNSRCKRIRSFKCNITIRSDSILVHTGSGPCFNPIV